MHASSTEQPTCAQRVQAAWQSRREDLKAMLDPSAEDLEFSWSNHNFTLSVCEGRTIEAFERDDWPGHESDFSRLVKGDPTDEAMELAEEVFEQHESDIREVSRDAFNEYGLCFDYVAPGTFDNQPTGYWRYQISWGGPSEEIRFYGSPSDNAPALIEFWYLDWFDGAPEDVTGDEIARLVWDEFKDTGTIEHAYEEAMQ